MEYLLNAFNGLNGIVWGAPMLALILGTGLFLMFLLKFMPLRKIGAGFALLWSGRTTNANENGDIVTAGGRVLCVTALGNTIGEAQAKALELCQKVTFDGVQYRKDIGYRAIARENA
mgnify:CR=1 FL=1